MAFQPTEIGCVEVVFRFTLFGIPLVIVITVCLDTPHTPSLGELTAIANAADAWMNFDMMGVLSKDLFYVSVTATDKSTFSGGQVTISHGAGIAGSINIAALPSQLAMVVTLYTALRGRNFRGRTFIPGIPLDYQGDNTNFIVAGDVTTVLEAYNALTSRLVAAASHQAVLSRELGGVVRPVALSQAVTSRVLTSKIGTLRRRSATAHSSG